MKPTIEQLNEPRRYLVNDEEFDSVTTILDILHKPGLIWWGQGIGAGGVVMLTERYGTEVLKLPLPELVDMLTAEKATVNHQRDQGATRGTAMHSALEAFLLNGQAPNPADYASEYHGYLRSLVAFLLDAQPVCETAEVAVASLKYRYAGTYDAVLGLDCMLRTPDGPRHFNGRYRIDLKTSKHVYREAEIQLAAYEAAAVECGEEPTDGQLVVRLDGEGGYEVVESVAVLDDFLAVQSVYNALKDITARHKARREQPATDLAQEAQGALGTLTDHETAYLAGCARVAAGLVKTKPPLNGIDRARAKAIRTALGMEKERIAA